MQQINFRGQQRFYLYGIADFTCIVFYAIVCHFHHFVNSSDCIFTTLQQVSQSIPTRVSVANKCLIAKSSHACDDSFLFLAPKLWNRLTNSIISITDFKTFQSAVTKHIFVWQFLTFNLRTLYV